VPKNEGQKLQPPDITRDTTSTCRTWVKFYINLTTVNMRLNRFVIYLNNPMLNRESHCEKVHLAPYKIHQDFTRAIV